MGISPSVCPRKDTKPANWESTSFLNGTRKDGGRSQNPNVRQVLNISDSLRMQGSMALEPFRGNSSRKRRAMGNLHTEEAIKANLHNPLPKRKRHK